jgi:glycosyltransferase involved in cell wall biosynthesis
VKIVFYTRYDKLGASSRYRFYNFKEYFSDEYKLIFKPFFNNKYLKNKNKKKNNFFNIIFSYFRRILQIINQDTKSIYVIEKELLPFFPAFIEKLILAKKKYILDYDDAIYLNYKNILSRFFFTYNKIENLVSGANYIIVGSDSLYSYLKKFNNNIILIPTVVNNFSYDKVKVEKYNKISLVWIGTQSTSKYFLSILTDLKKLKLKYDINIICIGALINDSEIISIKWKKENEIEILKKSHIGIMPLFNDKWSESKCGFKILQYMASKIPVVASNIGQNKIIIDENTGYLVKNNEWYDKLEFLINNKQNRIYLGENGYKKLISKYTYEISFPNFLKTINEVLKKPND